MTADNTIRVLVLGGGPDRERAVSLHSAANVAMALQEAGFEVLLRDIGPKDASALDERFDVVFPVLHGPFGEGGPLQKMLEQRHLRFVGSGSRAARKAIDKFTSKQVAARCGIPTPDFDHLGPTADPPFDPPLVLKPLTEGSSFGVHICHRPSEVAAARKVLHPHHPILLCERFVAGQELTVGILDDRPLPLLRIRPAGQFYDYHAKYDRDDTEYQFPDDLPGDLVARLNEYALAVHKALGCRHLSRVDFILDNQAQPWFIEINTMPGFTAHSLLPMAARHAGIDMPELVARLVRLALAD